MIKKKSKTIKEIAQTEDCVIVGRAADYILKDNPNLVKTICEYVQNNK